MNIFPHHGDQYDVHPRSPSLTWEGQMDEKVEKILAAIALLNNEELQQLEEGLKVQEEEAVEQVLATFH